MLLSERTTKLTARITDRAIQITVLIKLSAMPTQNDRARKERLWLCDSYAFKPEFSQIDFRLDESILKRFIRDLVISKKKKKEKDLTITIKRFNRGKVQCENKQAQNCLWFKK